MIISVNIIIMIISTSIDHSRKLELNSYSYADISRRSNVSGSIVGIHGHPQLVRFTKQQSVCMLDLPNFKAFLSTEFVN